MSDDALGEARRGLDRLRQPQAQLAFALHDEPVDDDLDRVLELLVERRHALLEQVLLAVDLHAREALAHAAPRTRPCTRPCGRARPAR